MSDVCGYRPKGVSNENLNLKNTQNHKSAAGEDEETSGCSLEEPGNEKKETLRKFLECGIIGGPERSLRMPLQSAARSLFPR